MALMILRQRLRKLWHFLWHDDSLLSWIVNFLLAFVLVKFVVYPGLGLLLGTEFPIVAVVSGSMEHEGLSFEEWWAGHEEEYTSRDIMLEDFHDYPFRSGFNKGDIMVLKGVEPQDIKVGDVVVYQSTLHRNPIIHRIVQVTQETPFHFVTKGDNNHVQDQQEVTEDQIAATGKAFFRIPYLGWIKIWFVSLLGGS